jgi:disulfide bond formation protein DsbB
MAQRKIFMLLAAFGSAAVLAGAFAFEYIGGLAPCVLCIWQRWPHAVAVVIGVIAIAVPIRILAWLGAAAALTSAAVGVFHVGVEQKLWAGLASCTASSMDGASIEDLLNPEIVIAAPIRCDAIAWQMLGISMAGWNVLISLVLVGLWLRAARHKD